MIEAHRIKKTYVTGKISTEVLHGIDLFIPEGQFVALIGRSGAGKSTLMHQLGLLDTPTEGVITLNAIDTREMKPQQKTDFRLTKLGFIFQDYALVPELSAVENVMLPLLMMGLSKAQAAPIAQKTLEKVGLSGRFRNLPSQLSGGEQQRVSVARAVAHDPLILFADEPTANLDSETAQTVINMLRTLHEEGQTIVMVTHEAEYANITDRIIELGDGNVISDTATRRHG
jgi:putative ABC transport system ATP-binding protein